MEACIAEIKSWMASNFLKLNDDKTEFIMFCSNQDLEAVSEWTVTVGDEEVLPSTTVRNIGAMLDSTLAMKSHINSVTKSCYLQIRNLSKIRVYLTEESAISLSHAFISSRLDCMNSLLHNIPKSQLNRLQLIQNNTARIIKKLPKSCHITQHLYELHWLPVEYRIQYKILLLVFKSLHGKGPVYLASMLEEYHPSRTLRSSAQFRLREPSVHKKYGERAFSVAGPRLWNALPLEVRLSPSVDIFKIALKTHLFKLAYGV